MGGIQIACLSGVSRRKLQNSRFVREMQILGRTSMELVFLPLQAWASR